ncbi:hypothetical protein M2447_001753 [Ereboglobus sp. PH5-10]|nr:hypothetical protein [Ereboglobus sp. PH5-10]
MYNEPDECARKGRAGALFIIHLKKWSLHEDLHLDFGLRTAASWLLDDEGLLDGKMVEAACRVSGGK